MMTNARFGGQSRDLPFRELDVHEYSSDQQIRRAVARDLDVSVKKLNPYVIERHANGYMTVRPEAIFG